MKRIIVMIPIVILVFCSAKAQYFLHYNFMNSLNEQSGAGPALTVLGNPGNFVIDTLSEIQGNNKMVYRFEKNNGLQFNNVAAGNFLGESYTIELYFVFDELTSWKRVVDWKNRKTDWGAYVYYGELNFYNILYSEEAPVVEDQYTYYVITRDGTSQKVLIYTDAEVKIDFTDTNGDALIDEDGVLNFFYDDLIVPNEAASGAVALLKLYNYALDSGEVKNNWNHIGGTVFGTTEVIREQEIRVRPNPASSYFTIDLPESKTWDPVNLQIMNMQGQEVALMEVPGGQSTLSVQTSSLARGIYYLRVSSGHEIYTARLLLK
jgi:hypothetical protein